MRKEIANSQEVRYGSASSIPFPKELTHGYDQETLNQGRPEGQEEGQEDDSEEEALIRG